MITAAQWLKKINSLRKEIENLNTNPNFKPISLITRENYLSEQMRVKQISPIKAHEEFSSNQLVTKTYHLSADIFSPYFFFISQLNPKAYNVHELCFPRKSKNAASSDYSGTEVFRSNNYAIGGIYNHQGLNSLAFTFQRSTINSDLEPKKWNTLANKDNQPGNSFIDYKHDPLIQGAFLTVSQSRIKTQIFCNDDYCVNIETYKEYDDHNQGLVRVDHRAFPKFEEGRLFGFSLKAYRFLDKTSDESLEFYKQKVKGELVVPFNSKYRLGFKNLTKFPATQTPQAEGVRKSLMSLDGEDILGIELEDCWLFFTSHSSTKFINFFLNTDGDVQERDRSKFQGASRRKFIEFFSGNNIKKAKNWLVEMQAYDRRDGALFLPGDKAEREKALEEIKLTRAGTPPPQLVATHYRCNHHTYNEHPLESVRLANNNRCVSLFRWEKKAENLGKDIIPFTASMDPKTEWTESDLVNFSPLMRGEIELIARCETEGDLELYCNLALKMARLSK